MNNKVTFPELVDAVANATNTPKRVSEIFLKELFGLVGDTLIAGENVKIKRLGTFKLIQVEARKSVNVNTGEEIEIPSHNKVSFIPDKELADAINLPFSGFETVILSDEIPEDELNRLSSTEEIEIAPENRGNTDDTDLIIEEEIPVLPEVSDNSDEENPESNSEEIAETSVEAVEGNNDNTECHTDNEPADNDELIPSGDESGQNLQNEPVNVTTDYTSEVIDNEPAGNDESMSSGDESVQNLQNEPENETADYIGGAIYNEREKGIEHNNLFKKGFIWGFISAMLVSMATFLFVAIVLGFPLLDHESETTDSNENADTIMTESRVAKRSYISEPVKKDTIVNNYVPKPETEIKRDTISRTRFLTTMAREYYGNYNFWVYIYEENRNIISNPNKIKPGTVIVIPNAEKYGINKDDPESLQAAKQKAFEIFKKYE